MIRHKMILIAILICFAGCRAAPTALPSPTLAVPRTPAHSVIATPTAGVAETSTPTRTPATPTAMPVPTNEPKAEPTPTAVPTATLFPTSPTTVDELPAPPISLAVDPFDQLGVYALLTNNTLYHTVDGGETWRKVPLPVPEGPADSLRDPARPNALSVTPQNDLAITSVWPRRIFLRVDQVLYGRSEGEADWTPLLDRVVSWDVDDGEGTWIYAWRLGERTEAAPGGTQTHGLYSSKNGGKTWAHVYKGFFPRLLKDQDAPGNHEGITSLAIDSDPRILYAGADDGLYRSLDGGHSWARFEEGVPETAKTYRWVPLLVNGAGGRIYALTEVSPAVDGGEAQAILARLGHGTYIPDEDRWVVVGSDVLSMLAGAQHGFWGVHTLAVDPDRPDRVYLGGEQGLWRSDDGGETWMPVDLGGGPEARPVGAVYRIAVRSGEEAELVFWSETGLHSHALSTPMFPPERTSNEVQFEVIGQVGGQSRAVAVTSGAIYAGIGPRIAGVGNTLRLAGLGAFGFTPPLPGIVNDMVVDEAAQVAYVAAGNAGLLIVDVSFLPIARVLGAVETRYPAQKVAVREGLAFVALGSWGGRGGLAIVDVALPEMPWLLADRSLPGAAHGVALAGDYAYLSYENGLVVLDASDPASPVEVARVPLPQCANDIAVDGIHAYVAADGLRILDVSDPALPRGVGHLQTPFCPFAVAVHDGWAYFADIFCEMGGCGSTLHVVDVRDPAQPRETGTWFTRSAVQDLAVLNDIVYLASRQKGIEAVDVREPASPTRLDAYGTLGPVTDVVVEAGFAYVSDGAESGLRVLDAATSPRGRIWPKVRGTVEMPWAGGYVVRDGLAYVPAWSAGLYIVDVSAPDAPEELWSRDIGQAAATAVVGNIAYVSVLDGLVVMDVSNPAAPEKLSQLSLAGLAIGLAVREGIAYVAVEGPGEGDADRLYAVDVHDPRDPQPVGEVVLEGSGLDVALAGDIAYVAVLGWSGRTPTGGVQTVGISDPGQPRTIGFLRLPSGAFDVQVSAPYAFVAGGEAGVYAVDLDDPANPRLVGHADTPGSARRVAVVGDEIYVADEAGGLIVLEVAR